MILLGHTAIIVLSLKIDNRKRSMATQKEREKENKMPGNGGSIHSVMEIKLLLNTIIILLKMYK